MDCLTGSKRQPIANLRSPEPWIVLPYPLLDSTRYKIIFHLFLHFLIPFLTAIIFFRQHWQKTWFLLTLTLLVDLDHLLATPIYDPYRCSINFHPLHGIVPIGLYSLMTLFKGTRLPGIGLLIHMGLDSIDCYANQGVWYSH